MPHILPSVPKSSLGGKSIFSPWWREVYKLIMFCCQGFWDCRCQEEDQVGTSWRKLLWVQEIALEVTRWTVDVMKQALIWRLRLYGVQLPVCLVSTKQVTSLLPSETGCELAIHQSRAVQVKVGPCWLSGHQHPPTTQWLPQLWRWCSHCIPSRPYAEASKEEKGEEGFVSPISKHWSLLPRPKQGLSSVTPTDIPLWDGPDKKPRDRVTQVGFPVPKATSSQKTGSPQQGPECLIL